MTGSKTEWISDLMPRMKVNIMLAVMKVELSKTKAGNDYLRLVLVDKTGTIEGRIWDKKLAREMYNTIEQDYIVDVLGETVDYNGLQLHIFGCKKVEVENINIKNFVPESKKDIDVLRNELCNIIKSINNQDILQLLQNIFSESFLDDFCMCVGGKLIHHNYLGGLLEHTLEVANYCELICHLQGQNMNRDILIAGAILHDVGKVFEYKKNSITFNFTEDSKMLGGHIILGRDFIIKKYPSCLSVKIRQHIEHLILSHHGKKEWGAVIEPQTVEAIALHQADLVSARVNQADVIVEKSNEQDDWTGYDKYMQKSIKIYNKY